MTDRLLVAPSVLSADFCDLGAAIALIKDADADWVHVDVMDGHFVPNITMGVPLVKSARSVTDLPLDVHLMVSNPLRQIPWFLDAGADRITFHAEAVSPQEADEAMNRINDAGKEAGIAVKPKTDLSVLDGIIEEVDMVLVMSVEPGFSGQSFMPDSVDRIRRVRAMADAVGSYPLIQVDGGIGEDTVGRVAQAGADCVVCGNAFFKAMDPYTVPRALRMRASAGCERA